MALTLGGLGGQLAGLALLGGGTGSESLPGVHRCYVATTALKLLTFVPVLLLHDPQAAADTLALSPSEAFRRCFL